MLWSNPQICWSWHRNIFSAAATNYYWSCAIEKCCQPQIPFTVFAHATSGLCCRTSVGACLTVYLWATIVIRTDGANHTWTNDTDAVASGTHHIFYQTRNVYPLGQITSHWAHISMKRRESVVVPAVFSKLIIVYILFVAEQVLSCFRGNKQYTRMHRELTLIRCGFRVTHGSFGWNW